MPTYGNTSKYGLRTFLGSNLASDIDQGFADLAADVDSNMAGYTQGTLASLPAAGKAGRIYRATDQRAVLMDTGAAWVDLVPQRVTSLPGTPYDGQVIHYVADATNGVIWPLRYNAASASAYKWESVGGPSLYSEILAAETTTSTTYVDLTTVGPQIVVPLAGDYVFRWGCDMSLPFGGGGSAEMALKFGAAAVSNDDRCILWSGTAQSPTLNLRSTPLREARRTVSAASTTVKAQYSGAGTSPSGATFQRRALTASPVRVG